MPKIPNIRDRETELEDFAEPSAWRRSKRDNLWRHWTGLNVTIFRRTDDYFGWSIANEDGPRYSRGGFETETDAMYALGRELGVGEL